MVPEIKMDPYVSRDGILSRGNILHSLTQHKGVIRSRVCQLEVLFEIGLSFSPTMEYVPNASSFQHSVMLVSI